MAVSVAASSLRAWPATWIDRSQRRVRGRATRLSTSFEIDLPPYRVAEYLAEPRHLLAANHKGPTVAQSEGPLVAGSWFILAFDQLRAHVEFVVFEPPERIAVTVTMSGPGSAGTRS